MVVLTYEELEEVRRAVATKLRASGHGTRHHEVCASVLKKLDESEYALRQRAGINGSSADHGSKS